MNFIIYDLEATCWKGRPISKQQETIEIGALKIDSYGDVLGEFSSFIRPKINPYLSAFCQELTTIEQTDVDRAPGFESAIEAFQDWIGIFDEDYKLCSWGNFDKQLLQQDCDLHKLEGEWLEQHINIKRQYREILRLHRPRGLKHAVETAGYEFTGTQHRAISDAQNLAKIFLKYLDEWRY
ncbi:MAG: exonuclease domain-containing protein [Saprospiraceae bacterium]|nr:exonuclease domain-containing protein [Saprospiraceae bacterium]